MSTLTGQGLDDILRSLRHKLPDETMAQGIVGRLVEENDTVMLVMPQDIQAPKGRLILPQVQTIRELLDRKCLVMSCTTDKIDAMLAALARPPKLIITDSQVFRTVYDKNQPRAASPPSPSSLHNTKVTSTTTWKEPMPLPG